METVLAVIRGIGLSAARGFGVFVPLLALNLAARYGYLNLAPGFNYYGNNRHSVGDYRLASIRKMDIGNHGRWRDHSHHTGSDDGTQDKIVVIHWRD